MHSEASLLTLVRAVASARPTSGKKGNVEASSAAFVDRDTYTRQKWTVFFAPNSMGYSEQRMHEAHSVSMSGMRVQLGLSDLPLGFPRCLELLVNSGRA